MYQVNIYNLTDLNNFALALIKSCQGNEILAVSGPLGVGKTALAKAIAKYLNIKESISSPSFNILKKYSKFQHPKIKNFIHIDAYRLKTDSELIGIGIEDYLNLTDTLIYIEWAEKVLNILPLNRVINIKINFSSEKKDARVITLSSPLKSE
jgi:tRNA threonylcarbamoyladenosine biosynthesis protein TsaE